MIGRKTTVFAFVWLALMIGAGVWAVLSLQHAAPGASHPWTAQHAGVMILQSAGMFAICLIVYALSRFFYPDRVVPPSHRSFLEVALVFMAITLAGGEVFSISWSMGWAGRNSLDLVTRIVIAATGFFYLVLGNWMPKLVTPFKDRSPEPYDWTGLNRLLGWSMVIAGLAMFVCDIFLTGVQALGVFLAPLLAPLVVWFAGWLRTKLGGQPPSRHLPPEGS
jgi:uncharacterized membrane protein